MKENASKNKYLLKNTIVLAIGNFGSKIITFLLVPLYTHVLTTAEYGTIDLITILNNVIVPLITLNIQEAILRYSLDKEINHDKILSLGIIIILFTTILCAISYPILKSINDTNQYAMLLALYMLSFSCSHIFTSYLRGNEQLVDYSVISIIQTLIIASLNILFLTKLRLGIKGYIIAYIVAFIVTVILCFVRGKIYKVYKNFKIDKELSKEMLKYSTLLIPNSLMWWIMNSLDKVMVTSMIGIEDNGIYAISYKLPSAIITFTTIFNQAWLYSAVSEKESEDKDIYTNEVYTALYGSLMTFATALILILKPFMSIYVGKDFLKAWMYTPPLIIGTVFLTLGSFLSNEYTANKDSKGFLKSSTTGAITNLIMNYILIPKIGVIGAAIATCISYIAVFIFRIFDTRKYFKLSKINRDKCIQLILLILSAIFVYMNNKYSYILNTILLIIQIYLMKNYIIIIAKKIKSKVKEKK